MSSRTPSAEVTFNENAQHSSLLVYLFVVVFIKIKFGISRGHLVQPICCNLTMCWEAGSDWVSHSAGLGATRGCARLQTERVQTMCVGLTKEVFVTLKERLRSLSATDLCDLSTYCSRTVWTVTCTHAFMLCPDHLCVLLCRSCLGLCARQTSNSWPRPYGTGWRPSSGRERSWGGRQRSGRRSWSRKP